MKQYLEFLESFVVITLAVAGLVGASYHLFRDGGWIDTVLGKVVWYHIENPMVAIPITALVIVIVMVLNNRRISKGKPSKVPTIILYTLMVAGVYFIGHYALRGTL